MDNNVISVNTHTDQEEVANIMQKYDLTSIPVTDSENRLVGIITIDDIIDILVNELGSTYPKTKNKELIFQCVCHGSEKEKLYYYPDSQLFHCYTNCGTMSLFDLLMNIYV